MSFDIVKKNRRQEQVVDLRKKYNRKKKIWGVLAFFLGIFFSLCFLVGGIYYLIKSDNEYLYLFKYIKEKTMNSSELNNITGAINEPSITTIQNKKEEEIGERKISEFRLKINTENLKIEAPVIEGASKESLAQGVGHHITTALPGFTGNVVIYGHRWYPGDSPYYTIFNNLDLLKTGDQVTIYYNGEEFIYKIKESKIVLSDQIEILKQTEGPQLTLYTCTPRYTSKKRLVYIGELVKWTKER